MWGIEYSGEKEPLCLACHSNGPPQKPTSQSAKRNYQEAMSDDEDNFDYADCAALSYEKDKEFVDTEDLGSCRCWIDEEWITSRTNRCQCCT